VKVQKLVNLDNRNKYVQKINEEYMLVLHKSQETKELIERYQGK